MSNASQSVNGSTRIMGVIGDPVEQVMTPSTINPIFVQMKANIVCLPMHILADELEAAWHGLKAIGNVVGFGVTLPHKQVALKLCDSLDDLAERVGAVNVVRREADGSFRGYQFDGVGFIRGLREQGHDPAGRDFLMAGAGGAAVAIAFALADSGASSLVIANRTRDKAEQLANAVNRACGRDFARAGEAILQRGMVLINATSLGLAPGDALPFDPDKIDETMLVAEVVAKPEITPLLEAAHARGAVIHSGLHMIRGQVGLIAEHLAQATAG